VRFEAGAGGDEQASGCGHKEGMAGQPTWEGPAELPYLGLTKTVFHDQGGNEFVLQAEHGTPPSLAAPADPRIRAGRGSFLPITIHPLGQ